MTEEMQSFVSRLWEEYTGVVPTSKETWKAIVHPDDWENMITLCMHSLSTGKPYEINLRLKSKSGEYSWHQGKGEAAFDNEGKIKKWVGAFTDMHILKEEQQRNDDFISITSHELKTPLTTIKAYGQIAEEMLEQGDLSALGMLKKMGNHVIKLSKLIEELLDVTKMQKAN
ncbi:MAG: PAS domain-containing protein [Bacteroidota bacterium]|nr:PAS domain-containing protein [Bacteroidota bacterium]